MISCGFLSDDLIRNEGPTRDPLEWLTCWQLTPCRLDSIQRLIYHETCRLCNGWKRLAQVRRTTGAKGKSGIRLYVIGKIADRSNRGRVTNCGILTGGKQTELAKGQHLGRLLCRNKLWEGEEQ